MNNSARDKIFKSWSGISEVALIKEVATKGEHVELCIEFWARKRKMSIVDYRLFFHDVVQTYVQRLLTERLVCKAENVLRNVQRDVRCFYYQFACECDDDELREMVLEHIRKKEEELQELHFNWELLQQLEAQPELLTKCKTHMPHRRMNLETMFAIDGHFRRRLLVELYFVNSNDALLMHLSKNSVWDYLVETHQCDELVRWFNAKDSTENNELEKQYESWLPVEPEMFEYALKVLNEPTEVLRDCFASAGYFFPDERNDVLKLLRRICTTQSFAINKEILEKTPIGRYVFQQKEYMLLMRPFVSVREIEELADEFQEQRKLLELVVALRKENISTREGFERISYVTKMYLQRNDGSLNVDTPPPQSVPDENPLVAFYEFLCYEPSIASLNCFLRSSALQHIPYLMALSDRLENGNTTNETRNGATCSNSSSSNSNQKGIPTAYELLSKFKHIDFKDIIAGESPNEIASFSNERMSQRYARKYQLNFLHYLKQQRSAYAVYYLLTTHLQSYAQLSRPQLFSACETVIELALHHAENLDFISHCVAFAEMLGFDTQLLRSLLKLTQLISEQPSHRDDQQSCISNYVDLMSQVETQLLTKLNINDEEQQSATAETEFPLAEYQALVRLVTSTQQKQIWPTVILKHFAAQDDWWRLLVLFHYFEVPLNEIRQLTASYGTRQIGEHILRALSFDAPPLATYERTSSGTSTINSNNNKKSTNSASRQRKVNSENAHPGTTSMETMTSSLSSSGSAMLAASKDNEQIQQLRFFLNTDQAMSIEQISNGKLDLFALALLSATAINEEPVTCVSKFLENMQDQRAQLATSWNLLRYCVKYQLPVLAMLAATINPVNVDWYWLVWLTVATTQWRDFLIFAVQLKDRSSELAWHVIQNAVRKGHVATVYRSICIFYGEQIALANLFRFLHLSQNTIDCNEKTVHELRLYLLAWSNDEVFLPLKECNEGNQREQMLQRSMQLFLIHLQYNFVSILEQQRFLAYICRSGMTDLCVGHLDFCLLNEVFTILQSSLTNETIPLNFERLLQQRNSHEEYKRLLTALLEAHNYDAAIQLATLLHLPICDIVYAKWVASLNTVAKQDINEDESGSRSGDGDEFKDRIDNEEGFDNIDFAGYEAEVVAHSLPPEVLVNFFLYAASRFNETNDARRKYILHQHALNVIKKHLLFPNELFDRDQIEYTMILCYLQLDETVTNKLSIYHSDYYEQIMLKERCVLYKSFLELKELAGIEDLNSVSIKTPLDDVMQERLEALLHRLLDEGDIVEALRLQELFECRPLDLRFIVFCMALAEGVTTIFSMSSEERQLLRDVEKSAFAKFNKRTLDTLQEKHYTYSSSPMRDDLSDSCSTLEFEEIPSKEKRETLETIQGIASKLKHGVDLGKRIVMAYRAAMYLDKEYLDVLRTKDSNVLLRSVAEEGCLHRLLVVSDILTSTHMTPQEIANLLAHEITTAVIRPRFYIFTADQQTKNSFKNADLWGYNIDRDLHLFLELTPSTTKLGNVLLEYCDALKTYRKYQDGKAYEHSAIFEKLAEIIRIYGLPTVGGNSTSTIMPGTVTANLTALNALTTTTTTNFNNSISTSTSVNAAHLPQVLSHKKQNLIYVELLIKAHQCFVHECSMEGIANVLNRAKTLNTALTHAKSWSLVVRMLIGIARYREMFYCFDSLIENDQFESLLGQFDEEKTIGLRQAILAYLREYGPENSREFLKLAALHFLMYKDLAEMWEQDAQMILAKILNMASMPNNNAAVATTAAAGGHNLLSNNENSCITRLRGSPEVMNLLQQALQNYTHATENYLLDNKLLLAQKSASMAEVIAMQIDLVCKVEANITNCVCVLNVQTRDEFRELVNIEMSVPQALILSRGYGYDINWTEALLSQYVLLMRKSYLGEFLVFVSINDSIIDNVVKGFQLYMKNNHKALPQMEENLAHLVTLVRSVTLKYKLASLLSLKTLVISTISDQTVHYLKDTNYGRKESPNLQDI